ncbi:MULTISPECIES: MBL fold metallo-hydrolase [unclassified Ekhidna]|jgi:glyoxylase-like metal-dependent hydrolase (beta-lactamase superfamily II)|uniref:MBL fold metallo-hydrolase n=1 Tax=unclassified Ekhidna TaxID=2632188 RepID=UPI0032E00562
MYHILDLHFQNYEHAIAAFLIETDDGPVLIESGPYSTFPSLEKGLADHGYKVSDVKHVLLSHIHFDHAGAAWAFAERGAKVYLHPFGHDHMHDPTKLVASATMIYGDQMDTLWGKMDGIPKKNLKVMEHEESVEIGGQSFRALHTPGHAKHHIAWHWKDTIFTGDVAGVKIEGGPVVPPCPPPDINIEDWLHSIDLILSKNPNKLVLTHFGEEMNPNIHMQELKGILKDWSEWMKAKWEAGMSNDEITPEFMAYTSKQLKDRGVSDHGIKLYEAANPSWMSVAGLVRYWKKKQGS